MKCPNCGGAHGAAFRGCGHYVRAQKIEKVRSEGKSYAEAVKVVGMAEKAAEVGGVEGGSVGERAPREMAVPAGSLIVDRNAFLSFLVEVLWAAKQLNASAGVRMAVVKEAEAFLGIVVTPEQLQRGAGHMVAKAGGSQEKTGTGGRQNSGGLSNGGSGASDLSSTEDGSKWSLVELVPGDVSP